MATLKYLDKKFHGLYDRRYTSYGFDWRNIGLKEKKTTTIKKTTLEERELSYRFYTHFHPYPKQLIKELIEGSISGLQLADTAYTTELFPNGKPKPEFYEEFFKNYNPDESLIPEKTNGSDKTIHPVKELDFSSSGGYSVYNWELFFHVPLTLAMHLSKNQRYEEALKWFHYIFDPGDDSPGSAPERFWHVKPFQQTQVRKIEEIMVNLSSQADPELFRDTFNSIQEWKNNPFRPHVIARYRQTAFMHKTVMAYLDNLIDWGDSLFLQDTGESISEASQLYFMAANILGPRPQAVPKKGTVKTQTYQSMRKDLDAFSNVLREMEVEIPFDLAPLPTPSGKDGAGIATLNSIGSTLYFCVPQNNNLLGYWDTVADRLYKIHNSLNLQGVFRQLPLFEPEIDPALLARAAAGGLDIASIINGLHQPMPLVRFSLMVQKATEICLEVKALGASVLSCIEKEDGESLSLIRAGHEVQIQQLQENVRYAQWQESIKTKEGIELSLKNSVARFVHYEHLLGNTDVDVQTSLPLDSAGLQKQKFKSEEPLLEKREIGYDFFAEALDAAGLGDLNSLRLNTPEALALLLDASTIPMEAMAITMDVMGSMMTIVPEVAARATPIGVGGGVSLSGEQLGKILQLMGSATRGGESILRTISGISSSVAGHLRRRQEWELQSQNLAGEINGIYKQLIAAQIREYIAKKEYENHKVQVQQSRETEAFLKGEKIQGFTKTSTQGFYAYMKREVKALHNKYFKFAFDIARKAERSLQLELGNSELSFLQYNYMAGKEGLYAGEKLAFDLKRMEMAYYDLNQRELELNKHISMAQLDPAALLQLRFTGKCSITLPEEAFDLGGCEGHYFRRIKTVSLSIPCIAGPYTSVNCTLTLTKSSVRIKSTLLDGQYSKQENDTERFSSLNSSISIVTSSAQNDRGIFDFNANDERYLPFEYAGVISEWQLELADEFRQFDYQTITDVIFHISYTARQGGGLLKNGAVENLKTMIGSRENSRMFSLKFDFPTDYHRFMSQGANAGGKFLLSFTLQEFHYPYWSLGHVTALKGIEVHAVTGTALTFTSTSDATKSFTTTSNPQLTSEVYPGKTNQVFSGSWDNIPLPQPISKVEVLVDSKQTDDLWVMVKW